MNEREAEKAFVLKVREEFSRLGMASDDASINTILAQVWAKGLTAYIAALAKV